MERINDLATAIEQYEQIQGATQQPWFCNEVSKDEYGCDYVEIGPYSLQERHQSLLEDLDDEDLDDLAEECIEGHNFYYEEMMASFVGDNHNANANAQLAVAAVNLVPRLIARIRELESKTATALSEDVENALDALNKWRNRV